MDWDNLKFFLALAETGSLSLASEKLRVDHSTVARRIDMLERDLGIRLVGRLPRPRSGGGRPPAALGAADRRRREGSRSCQVNRDRHCRYRALREGGRPI